MSRRAVLLPVLLLAVLLGSALLWRTRPAGDPPGVTDVETRAELRAEDREEPGFQGVGPAPTRDEGAASRGDDEQEPTPPATTPVATGRISGRVIRVAGQDGDFRVVWTSTTVHPHPCGSGAVAADGTFSLEVPNAWGPYQLHVRPADAFWPDPWDEEEDGIQVPGRISGVTLEMPRLDAFTLHVEGSLDGEGELPVQMGSADSRFVPTVRTHLDPGARDVELRGIRPGGRYWVYVGPTSDGRCLYWVGRTPSGGRADAGLDNGGAIWGRVSPPSGTAMRPRSTAVTAYAAVEGLRLASTADAEGDYEIPGLLPGMLWDVRAEGKTEGGRPLRSDHIPCLPRQRVDLVLKAVE